VTGAHAAHTPRAVPPVLTMRDLVVERGGRAVLAIDAFAVHEGETVAVVGPNGAGKSTLLLALGTLIPSTGTLLFRGDLVGPRDRLAYRRRLGLVLAAPLLLDTSVYENVAAGLRFRHVREAEIRRRTGDWLERLGVAHLASRHARQVSSGEAQRVSLARALVLEPDVLLLDEPFASVDAAMRTRLVDDLERVLRETRIACVIVTHDLEEAVRLGHGLAVVVDGRLRQLDRPERVLANPVDEAVAQFVGVETRLPGRVRSTRDGNAVVAFDGTSISVAGIAQPGREVLCCLRPEDITLRLPDDGTALAASGGGDPAAVNRIPGIIERIVPQGPIARVTVDCGTPLVAILTRASVRELGLVVGAAVVATFAPSSVHLIDRPT
jgi:tungstate transport system ATP-binding protein